jgi:DNA mismatch endonuclease (patch repair protein)
VLPKYKCIIFVNGCFWHRHEGCKEASVPKTNAEYWEKKIARNIERDFEAKQKLESAGWKVIVVWECEVDDGSFSAKILQEIDRNANFGH